jgi:hypothetical protein
MGGTIYNAQGYAKQSQMGMEFSLSSTLHTHSLVPLQRHFVPNKLKDYELDLLNNFNIPVFNNANKQGAGRYYSLTSEARLFFLPFGLQLEMLILSGNFQSFRFSWERSTGSSVDRNVKNVVNLLESFSENLYGSHKRVLTTGK